LVGYCQPSKSVELLRHRDDVPGSPVRVDHGVDGRSELVAALPSGKEIDVLARTIQDAVNLNGVTAGQGEAEPPGHSKPNFRQLEQARIHVNRPEPEVAGPVPGSVTATAPASGEEARDPATSVAGGHRRAIGSSLPRFPLGSGLPGT
jgi:hypothetical protein